MTDTAGLNLKEPEQVSWDAIGASKYQEPPDPIGPDGKPITFYGTYSSVQMEQDDDGYRRYLLDPIKIVKSGGKADGYTIRFTRVGLKPWKNGQNHTAVMIKSAGVQAKPQSTAEYDAAVKAIANKPVAFNIDWEARNKDTGEAVKGIAAFIDPVTGQRRAILRKGDVVPATDDRGQPTGGTRTIESEVLFANARITFFRAGKK